MAYKVAQPVNTYATYATSFKSVGLNLNGVPTDAQDQPVLSAATVKPEDVRHIEVGDQDRAVPRRDRERHASTTPRSTTSRRRSSTPASACCAAISPTPRRCACAASSSTAAPASNRTLSFYAAAAFTDGKYVVVPRRAAAARGHGRAAGQGRLGHAAARASRRPPSPSAASTSPPGGILGRTRQFFGAFDTSYRSSFSSSASASRYLVVDGYSLLNARVGFRAADGWTLSVWARNLLNKDYFDLLSAAPGNTGLYVGQPGDPRTFGVTLRVSFKSN